MGFSGTKGPGRATRLARLALTLFALTLFALPMTALADGEDPSAEPGIEASTPVAISESSTSEGSDAPDNAAAASSPDVVAEAAEPTAESVPTDEGSPEAEDVADETTVEAEVAAEGVVTLKLAAGTLDHGGAQAVVEALNRQLAATAAEGTEAAQLVVDGDLQEAAAQRAAEIAVWLSARRPSGAASLAPGATEFRTHGSGLDAAAVANQLASSVDLAAGGYRSVGVGCWGQGAERFYVILLDKGTATPPATTATGTEDWAPEVAVDLGGTTSSVLTGRLQASGYRTNLPMVPGSTRAVRFSWVTAPEEADLASASNLPSIAIDPESFTWSSDNETVAPVSPKGVVTMRATSTLTPQKSLEAGANITANLEGTDRTLTFHVIATVPVYRLFHPGNNSHLYTTDANEYRSLPSYGWQQEQVVWQSVWSPHVDGQFIGTPIYRLNNPFNGDHHYTADVNEYRTLPNRGWVQEGVAYYSADGTWDDELGGQPVYRLFNSYLTANGGLGSHLWTTSGNERSTLEGLGWTMEGASLFGVR